MVMIEDYRSLPPNIAWLVPEGKTPLEFVTLHAVRELRSGRWTLRTYRSGCS